MRREIQLAGYTITAEEWGAFDEDTRDLLLRAAHVSDDPYLTYEVTLLEAELAQPLEERRV
jgi:hypothetical protein